jgi:hypothetical protein
MRTTRQRAMEQGTVTQRARLVPRWCARCNHLRTRYEYPGSRVSWFVRFRQCDMQSDDNGAVLVGGGRVGVARPPRAGCGLRSAAR